MATHPRPQCAMSMMGAAMAEVPWPPEMKMFEPYITTQLWFKEAPKLAAVTAAFEKYAWPCHRFNSCIEEGKWVRRHDEMDVDYHFEEEVLEDENEVDQFTMKTQLTPLEYLYPRWKVFMISIRSGGACVIFHVHHSIGDGLGLLLALSPMLSVDSFEGTDVLATVPLPNSVLPTSVCRAKEAMRQTTAPAAEQAPKPPQRQRGILKRYDLGITTALRSWARGTFGPLLQDYDTELSINEPLSKRKPVLPFSGSRIFTRFPPVPMTAVSAVRKTFGCSFNDVVMAALTGALRRYAIEVKGDTVLRTGSGAVEFKSIVVVALPRPIDESDLRSALCNKIIFASQKLPIDEPSERKRMERIILACNDLKSKSYMCGLVGLTKFVTGIAPASVVNKAAGETFSKHSVLVTNIPAMSVAATWPAEGGVPIEAIRICNATVMPQISVISYNRWVYASIVADPELIGFASKLGQFWSEEFEILAAA